MFFTLLEGYYSWKLNRWLERYNRDEIKNADGSPVFLFATAFVSGHPIRKLYPQEVQYQIITIGVLLIDDALPEASLEEKHKYLKKQLARAQKNFISRWFWSHR